MTMTMTVKICEYLAPSGYATPSIEKTQVANLG